MEVSIRAVSGAARAADSTAAASGRQRKAASAAAMASRRAAGCLRSASGSVTFGVTRTFATVDAALTYLKGAFLAEPSEGQLTFDDADVFGANHKSVVTQRTAALVGCTVAVNYSITG